MSRNTVKIILVEPSEIICRGLTAIIDETNVYKIMDKFDSIVNITEKIIALSPDMVIINPTLFTATEKNQWMAFIQRNKSINFVALVYQYIESGSVVFYDGIIDVRDNAGKILGTLKSCCANSRLQVAVDNDENYDLSERELDILTLVAKGKSSKEIAEALNISVYTVNTHRKNITGKTGIKSSAGFTMYAILHNLIDGKM